MKRLAQYVIGLIHNMGTGTNNQRIRATDHMVVFVRVWERVQEMQHAVQSGPLFVVGFYNRPGSIGDVGVEKHRFLRFGILLPFVERSVVNG